MVSVALGIAERKLGGLAKPRDSPGFGVHPLAHRQRPLGQLVQQPADGAVGLGGGVGLGIGVGLGVGDGVGVGLGKSS